jgi:hypothetical protein
MAHVIAGKRVEQLHRRSKDDSSDQRERLA